MPQYISKHGVRGYGILMEERMRQRRMMREHLDRLSSRTCSRDLSVEPVKQQICEEQILVDNCDGAGSVVNEQMETSITSEMSMFSHRRPIFVRERKAGFLPNNRHPKRDRRSRQAEHERAASVGEDYDASYDIVLEDN